MGRETWMVEMFEIYGDKNVMKVSNIWYVLDQSHEVVFVLRTSFYLFCCFSSVTQ